MTTSKTKTKEKEEIMNEKAGLEQLFSKLTELSANLDGVYKSSNNDWPKWHSELEDFKKQLMDMLGTNSEFNQQLHGMLHSNEANGDAAAAATPNKPLTKEEKAEMARQMKELDQLFDVAKKVTDSALQSGAIGPEDVRNILNDLINRVLQSLPENNPYKQVLKHLKNRIEAGDEIQTLLDRAQKVKQTKTEQVKENQQITVDTSNVQEMLKGLAMGALGAGAVAMAPKVGAKVANSDMFANLLQGLQTTLAGAVEQEVEVEDVEDVEIEEALEVEAKDEVRIEI